MNPQETIIKMLAVEGDCYCNSFRFLNGQGFPIKSTYKCKKCEKSFEFIGTRTKKQMIEEVNLDLTTEVGAFWLLKRLPEWNRFDEFIQFIYVRYKVHHIGAMFIWLTTDAKDGEAPALYEALVEFTGVEI